VQTVPQQVEIPAQQEIEQNEELTVNVFYSQDIDMKNEESDIAPWDFNRYLEVNEQSCS
jgi:hypothetical protein